MAILVPNSFSSFQLSEFEEETGSVLTPEHKAVLQNKLSNIAHQKLNLVFNPNDVLAYAQQVAYLQGQLDVIQWQLDTSIQVEELLYERLKQQDQAQ